MPGPTHPKPVSGNRLRLTELSLPGRPTRRVDGPSRLARPLCRAYLPVEPGGQVAGLKAGIALNGLSADKQTSAEDYVHLCPSLTDADNLTSLARMKSTFPCASNSPLSTSTAMRLT